MALQSRENVLVLWLIPIQKTVQLKGMQTSKQGMWKGHHFSIEGIRKGYLFREKNGIKNGKWLDLGAESPRINICWVPSGGAVGVHKWQPVLLLLFVSSDYCRIPKTKEYIVHRSTVVSTYWIWSGLYVSSSENMEVRLSGVLIIDYNRPLIKALKQRDNRSWTEMFNRLLRGTLVCCLLNRPHLFIDGPFMIWFVPSWRK